MKKKVFPKLRQEVKVDIVTSDDIKIYYNGKFQDFTARYIIKIFKKVRPLVSERFPNTYCERCGIDQTFDHVFFE